MSDTPETDSPPQPCSVIEIYHPGKHEIKTTMPQITIYFKPPSHCCQKCGKNIGWFGRFLFRWEHRCSTPDSQNIVIPKHP
jgi:hypothetical protein